MDQAKILNENFVKSILDDDPVLAEEICQKKGIDFKKTVSDFVTEIIESGQFLGTTKEENINSAIDRVGRELLSMRFVDIELSEKNLASLSVYFPSVLEQRRQEIITFLAAPVLRPTRMSELVKALPNITADIIRAFNADERVRTLNDDELVAKIRHISNGHPSLKLKFAPDLYDKFLAIQIADFCSKGQSTLGLLDELLSDNFPKHRQKNVLENIILRLSRSNHYLLAAKIASFGELNRLEKQMASLAYQGCINRKQFKDAAEICNKHGIRDACNAGEKELVRLIDQKKFETAIEWAGKFKLAMPKELVVIGYRNHLIFEIDILIKHDPETAKQAIRARILRDGLAYYANKKLFSREETIADLSQVGIKEGCCTGWLIEMLNSMESLGRVNCLEKIVCEIINGWIVKATPLAQIEKLVELYLTNYTMDHFRAIARETAINHSQKNWEKFLEICETWGFDDLKEQFVELSELLPPRGNWRNNTFLLGAVLKLNDGVH